RSAKGSPRRRSHAATARRDLGARVAREHESWVSWSFPFLLVLIPPLRLERVRRGDGPSSAGMPPPIRVAPYAQAGLERRPSGVEQRTPRVERCTPGVDRRNADGLEAGLLTAVEPRVLPAVEPRVVRRIRAGVHHIAHRGLRSLLRRAGERRAGRDHLP